MNAEQLDQLVAELLKKQNKWFWLQDQEFNMPPSKGNCIPSICPRAKKSNPEQAENIAPWVLENPGIYVLTYRRSWDGPDTKKTIDTRNNTVTINEAENMPAMPIDERDRSERRNDELYIRQLERDNARLEEKVIRLEGEIERLEQELNDIDAEVKENAQSAMADQTVSTVGQVVQILPAVLDKWFSLQEQKNQLMAEQLRRTAAPRPQYQPQQNQYDEEAGY